MLRWTKIKTRGQLKKKYLSVVPKICSVARKCGYAIAVHGSMQRDLDIIAMPWVPHALKPETLVIRIEKELTGYSHARGYWRLDGKMAGKPHGRLAYAIPIAHLNSQFENPMLRHAYIDLSLRPPLPDA